MATNEKEFRKILHHFDTAMLVTQEPEGHLRARPMYIADCDEDGGMWFVTSVESEKAKEVVQSPQCSAVMQGEGMYLSVNGRGRMVVDTHKAQQLWRAAWRTWFPEGARDSRLCLIHLEPRDAEYWDTTGVRGLRFAFKTAAKAYLNKERMEDDSGAGTHGRVHFH